MQLGVTLLLVAVVLAAQWLLLQRLSQVDRRFDGVVRADDLRDLRTLAESAASDARLRPLEESVRRLSDAVAKLPAPLEAKDLVPVQERLEMLARAIDELRHHVDELRTRGPEPVVVPGSGARVLRTLEQHGFDSIRIVGQVAGEEGGDSARVPVEARRAGMSFKGYVTLAEGRVADVSLKPVTEVFP